jgi:hypothetical protein
MLSWWHRDGRGPFRNVTADGTHIHHSVPGIILLMVGVCVLKGKYRSGLFGLFLAPVGFIGAVRLASAAGRRSRTRRPVIAVSNLLVTDCVSCRRSRRGAVELFHVLPGQGVTFGSRRLRSALACPGHGQAETARLGG